MGLSMCLGLGRIRRRRGVESMCGVEEMVVVYSACG